jgi:ROK family
MRHTLCIDIGGTRIKSAVLPENPTIEQVENAPSMVVRTLGWLNHSLPKLIDPGHWPSLAAHYREHGIHYDAVALSVPGVVDGDGRFLRHDLIHGPAKAPEHLLKALKNSSGLPVSIIKDADAWMMGFQTYAEARDIQIDYPAVLMAFGTGFGIAAASSPANVVSIEAGERPASSWGRLASAAEFKITEGWQIHKIIGRPFFEFVEGSRKDWDHLKIREEYTKRVKAALQDILPWIEDKLGCAVRTCVLTGGNAEYLSVRSLSQEGRKVISLTDRLSELPPDLITVLGVEASSRRPRLKTLQ